LGKWTEEEVKTWFLNGKYTEYQGGFEGLDGVELNAMNRKDCLDICKEMKLSTAKAIGIYNAVQALKTRT